MIEYIEIEGYKSIRNMQLEMRPINILIGSNGVGKSNFISFFKLINAIFNQRLQRYVIEEKADNILYFGRKTTEELFGKIIFKSNPNDNNAYHFTLAQTKEGGLYLLEEASGYNVHRANNVLNYYSESNLEESKRAVLNSFRDNYLRKYITNLHVFHFHDTSATSFLRRQCDISDNLYLKQDGRNLPAFLYLLKVNHPKIFRRIEKTVQSVAPYIINLILEPNRLNTNEIELRWTDNGDPESNFSAFQFSDGTLRFIALATLLMQPTPPGVIVIDEPELGLHPFAIGKLAAMIQAVSNTSQVIVATQSPGLINHFSPEDILVMDKSEEENQTIIKRLDPVALKVWLEDFTLGDLWERNIINAAQPFNK